MGECTIIIVRKVKKLVKKERDTHSYITILTASLSRDSPNMILYNLGSTLYWLKMARMVTGSVAESVEPNIRHSNNVNSSDSKPSIDQM